MSAIYKGVKSNITMIAKVCDHESRRDSWFENRLVSNFRGMVGLLVISKILGTCFICTFNAKLVDSDGFDFVNLNSL